jgi:hypothetical protein
VINWWFNRRNKYPILNLTINYQTRSIKFGLINNYQTKQTQFNINQNPAKPASDWLEKKVARGKLWQNPRDELQNIEFNQSSAKALHELCQSPAKALHEAPYEAL